MVFEAPHPGRRVTLSKSDEKLKRDEHSSEMRSHEPKPSIETKPQQKKVSRVRVRRRPSQFTVEGADFSEILAVAEEMGENSKIKSQRLRGLHVTLLLYLAKECGDYENLDPNEANDMETAIK
ncbi:unnamed protein product [Cylicostephanus goldi]|uniref:Uncharacterized protein n=1 Tax=Cylicostephanus goldi TaxID=71465 RepID=A0A3P6RQ79_CYLGO|nr:unnamed protein product [Cylicostephanus goldi]